MSENADKNQKPAVKRVVSTKPTGHSKLVGIPGPADPNAPWQTADGHDKIIPGRQAAAAKMRQFERVTAGIEDSEEAAEAEG